MRRTRYAFRWIALGRTGVSMASDLVRSGGVFASAPLQVPGDIVTGLTEGAGIASNVGIVPDTSLGMLAPASATQRDDRSLLGGDESLRQQMGAPPREKPKQLVNFQTDVQPILEKLNPAILGIRRPFDDAAEKVLRARESRLLKKVFNVDPDLPLAERMKKIEWWSEDAVEGMSSMVGFLLTRVGAGRLSRLAGSRSRVVGEARRQATKTANLVTNGLILGTETGAAARELEDSLVAEGYTRDQAKLVVGRGAIAVGIANTLVEGGIAPRQISGAGTSIKGARGWFLRVLATGTGEVAEEEAQMLLGGLGRMVHGLDPEITLEGALETGLFSAIPGTVLGAARLRSQPAATDGATTTGTPGNVGTAQEGGAARSTVTPPAPRAPTRPFVGSELQTEAGARRLAEEQPAVAEKIAAKERPSRRDIEGIQGAPRLLTPERRALGEMLRRIIDTPTSSEPSVPAAPGRRVPGALANPARSEEARAFVEDVDRQRAEQGIPERRAGETVDREAADRLREDRSGERDRLLKMADEGTASPTDTDVEIGQQLTDEAAQNAVENDSQVRSAVRLVNAYRDVGTGQGRALARRRDPVRASREHANQQIIAPSKRDAKSLGKLHDRIVGLREELRDAGHRWRSQGCRGGSTRPSVRESKYSAAWNRMPSVRSGHLSI